MGKYITLLLCGLVMLIGCRTESSIPGLPKLVPYKIKITQEGKPLAGAYVQLKGDTHSLLIDGVTGPDGYAIMRTQMQYTGVPVGHYAVLVRKVVYTPSKFGDEVPLDSRKIAEWKKNREEEYRPAHSYVLNRFNSFATSGLDFTISKHGMAEIEVGPPVDEITIVPNSASSPNASSSGGDSQKSSAAESTKTDTKDTKKTIEK